MVVARRTGGAPENALLAALSVERGWSAGADEFRAMRENNNLRESRLYRVARAAQEQSGAQAEAQASFARHTFDTVSVGADRLRADGRADREMFAGVILQQTAHLGNLASSTVGVINTVVEGSKASVKELRAIIERLLEEQNKMAAAAQRQMEAQEKGAQREIAGLKERIAFLEDLLNEAERRWLQECLSICQLASKLPRERVIGALKERGRFFRDRLDRIDQAERKKLLKMERIEAEERRRIEEESQRIREAESAAVEKARFERTQQSRNRQIEMARVSLGASYASLQDGRDWVRAACIIAIIALPILSYKYSGERWLITLPLTALSWIGAALVLRSCNQEVVKRRWIGLYLKGLDRLAADEKLTVRQAVRAQLKDDRTISPEILASEGVRGALGRIGDVLVIGNPDEARESIPAVLRTLVEHAEQPPSTFIDIFGS